MTLLDSVVKTIGGPSPKQVPQANSDEERLTKSANLSQGREQDQSIPAYPHQNEPEETVAEHRTEQVIGREIRPAPRPRQSIPPMVRQPREIPQRMFSCTVPKCTNAGRMLNKPAPRGMTGSPRVFGASPRTTGDFMKFDIPSAIAPKQSPEMDPFQGLDGGSFLKKKSQKKLPAGMQMFGRKGTGKRGMW